MIDFWRKRNTRPVDDLGSEMRVALATLVKRAIKDGDFTLKVWGGELRDFPIGNWVFTVQRLPNEPTQSTRSEGAPNKPPSVI